MLAAKEPLTVGEELGLEPARTTMVTEVQEGAGKARAGRDRVRVLVAEEALTVGQHLLLEPARTPGHAGGGAPNAVGGMRHGSTLSRDGGC